MCKKPCTGASLACRPENTMYTTDLPYPSYCSCTTTMGITHWSKTLAKEKSLGSVMFVPYWPRLIGCIVPKVVQYRYSVSVRAALSVQYHCCVAQHVPVARPCLAVINPSKLVIRHTSLLSIAWTAVQQHPCSGPRPLNDGVPPIKTTHPL